MKKQTLPIFLAFLCMGFGDVVGPLVSLAKDTFNLSYTMAQLLPFVGFLMFGLLSVPMGVYQDKKGKKFILLLGLSIALIGLVIPMLTGMYGPKIAISSDEQWRFYVVLGSIFLLGAGSTILQVVGNPIMRDVSPEGAYSKNLSLAQSVKAIGSSLGFLVPPLVGYAFGMDWTLLFPIYSILILITLILSRPLEVKETRDPNSKTATVGSCLSLLKSGYVFMMVFGIFVYVGAEVSMSSGVPLLLKANFGYTGFSLLVSWALFFLPILLGRFLGSMILGKLAAKKFLVITVVLSIIGILSMYSGNEIVTFAGIILVGLGFANIFPLIFSITIDRMPERSNELSGLMVTAIVGGAFIPLLMGKVADSSSILAAFIVPLICVAYILYVSLASLKKS